MENNSNIATACILCNQQQKPWEIEKFLTTPYNSRTQDIHYIHLQNEKWII